MCYFFHGNTRDYQWHLCSVCFCVPEIYISCTSGTRRRWTFLLSKKPNITAKAHLRHKCPPSPPPCCEHLGLLSSSHVGECPTPSASLTFPSLPPRSRIPDGFHPRASQIFEYNGSAVVAMVGKNCFAIASDRRLGVQLQTVATDFQRVFKIHDKLYIGLSGLATDTQTL
jgi:hypothetical protein